MNNGEFIATQPGNQVGVSDAAAQTVGDNFEQLVADYVSESIVHALELIEIEIQESEASSPLDERERPRTAQSFCVPKAEIAAQGYDLSLNRYKEVVHEPVEHRAPKEILAELAKLETEIQKGMKELEGMVG